MINRYYLAGILIFYGAVLKLFGVYGVVARLFETSKHIVSLV